MITGESNERDFVFIHVPKVAGNSIGVALGRPTRNHKIALLRKAEHSNDAWNAAFKFCFVRNPWDFLVSWFTFHKGHADMYRCDFEGWLRKGMPTHWGKDWCGERPNDPLNQFTYFQDETGKDMVDFIGAYENLEEDMAYVCQQINRDSITLPTINKTNHAHYRDMYNDETRRMVRNRFANFIGRFGYEF